MAAAIEQWETDLKRKLASIVVPQREQWEEDLLKEIQEIDEEIPPQKQISKTTTMFMVWLIILGFLVVFVYDRKTNVISQWFDRTPNTTTEETRPSPSPTSSIAELRNAVRQNQADNIKIATALEKTQAKTRLNSERIILLGMLANENSMVYRNNYDKNDLVFLNRNWTLNQMPKHLQMTAEDREYLNKFVNQDQ